MKHSLGVKKNIHKNQTVFLFSLQINLLFVINAFAQVKKIWKTKVSPGINTEIPRIELEIFYSKTYSFLHI